MVIVTQRLALMVCGVVAVTLTYQAGAQRGQPPVQPAMTNADVIDMTKAGLGEAVILAAIQQAARKAFDTSAKALVALKQAGVTDNVLRAMLGGEGAPPPVAPAGAAGVSTATRLTPGIYVQVASGPVPLEPTVISQVKTAGRVATVFSVRIAPTRVMAEVVGARANIRITNREPVFFFNFSARQSRDDVFGAGPFLGWMAPASSPNEFALVQLFVESNRRELQVGKASAFATSAGVDAQRVVSTRLERTATGACRVTVAKPLPPGEYCFFYTAGAALIPGSTVSAKLFDFGVD